MLNFIKENIILILAVISILFEMLILISKKKPKTLDDFLDLLHQCVSDKLPEFINSVEIPGNGSDKKIKVVLKAKDFICKKLGRNFSQKEDEIFYEYVSKAIESILTTPQKKEI